MRGKCLIDEIELDENTNSYISTLSDKKYKNIATWRKDVRNYLKSEQYKKDSAFVNG